jgi:hypothetical protein
LYRVRGGIVNRSLIIGGKYPWPTPYLDIIFSYQLDGRRIFSPPGWLTDAMASISTAVRFLKISVPFNVVAGSTMDFARPFSYRYIR